MRPLLLALLASSLFGQTTNNPWLNPDLTAAQRAHEIVSRLTLDEKVLQMQDQAPAIPRLGIPAYGWWNEALHGVARAGKATVFPQAIGLAATWNTSLMHQVADIISTEARAKYNEDIRHDVHDRYHGLTFWSPNINIFRDPRWGRGQETYGEDPFLTGRMAVAFIHGMQGDDPHYFKVIATAKHYAVHSGPEPIRHKFDVQPSPRDLEETYLPAFRASVVEGKVDSIMCAYNAIDGKPACVNSDLLEKHLRGDWAFQGYVVSDCGAIRDIFAPNSHHYKPNAAEADALAVKTGTDLTCGNEYRALTDSVKQGLIAESEIDRSVERLFIARFKLGMFDPSDRVPFNKIPYSVDDSPEHRKVALEAARQSIVLLKNQNQALPLKPSVRKIAVVGPSADDPVALRGNYNGFSSKEVTPLDGMEARFAGKITFAPGATYTSQTPSLVPSSVLTPPAGQGHGVQAEYFTGADFQGAPKLSRIEPRVYFEAAIPDPALTAALGNSAFSVRWTGTLHAPGAGDYAFSTRGAFGPSAPHIFLDGKELAPPAHVQLEAGKAYSLRIEYHSQGPNASAQLMWLPPAEPLLADAIAAVKDADVAVVFAGLNPNLEGEEMRVNIPGFEGGDRTSLNLPETQEKLIQAAVATGKPVVVVLTSGSAVAATYAVDHAAAVLEAWYGGEEIGTAIADTLAGANNPAGRLPVTFYKSVDQLPPFEDYAMKGHTYRYFTGDQLYSFGYGLSYSTFRYSNLKAARSAAGGAVTVRVKNDSHRDGDEVVQLYLSGAGAPDDAIRSLAAFARIHLRAGESRDVQLTIPPDALPKAPTKFTVGGGQPVPGIAHIDGIL